MISRWETALREKGSGKFETRNVIRFVYENRLYWKHRINGYAKLQITSYNTVKFSTKTRWMTKWSNFFCRETERERLLLCYQTSLEISKGRFPVNKELCLELAALMSQVSSFDIQNHCLEWRSWFSRAFGNTRMVVISYNSIKLLTFNHCHQTPLRRSCTDPKPMCHFDPLLPRIVYVAWLFGSCISLWVPVQNIKEYSSNSSEK